MEKNYQFSSPYDLIFSAVFSHTYKKEYLSIHLRIFLTAEYKTSISDECCYQKIPETRVIYVSIIWKQETVTFEKLESFEFLI